MVKYFIFRHAETFPSKYSVPYEKDNFNAPILYEGKDATLNLANYFKNIPSDFNVSSSYKRCRETVKIITQITGKKFIFDSRIGEFYQIEYEKFKKRIKDFVRDIKKKGYQSVIICTHGAVMSLLVPLLCGKKPEEQIPVNEYKDTGTLVIAEDKVIKTIDFNTDL